VKVLASGEKTHREFASGPTWRRDVEDVVGRLIAAIEPDEVVLGGGNVHQLGTLPPQCRAGDNADGSSAAFACGK
jgi:polyphosphate glucokinase